VGDFVSPCLALTNGPAEVLEGLQEEGFDVMRLQPPRFGPLHVLPDPPDTAHVHGLVGEGALFQEVFHP